MSLCITNKINNIQKQIHKNQRDEIAKTIPALKAELERAINNCDGTQAERIGAEWAKREAEKQLLERLVNVDPNLFRW